MVDDLHSIDIDGMWLTSENDSGPAWIQYDFDKPYALDQMLVWNYNGEAILAGLGFKDVTIEYSADGANWIQLGDYVFPQAPGANGYDSDITVDFGGIAVKAVKLNATSNWLEMFPQYGLSEVRFMTIPLSARKPSPESDATDVAINTTLSWRAGRQAAEHQVYLSMIEQEVTNGTAPVVTVSQASDGPLSLDLGTVYYWRVDEVNNAETVPVWPGDTWSFTTQESLVVDDFESYNDIPTGEEGSNLVYETWTDGYANPSANGSTIGYASGASMETNTFHGGEQSVPVLYDNTTASISEVTVDPAKLEIGRDWTKGSPQALVLWIYGDPNNTAADRMYVKVNNAKTIYEGDLAQAEWQEFQIDMAALGIDLSNVTSLTIGFERTGAAGGSGTVFVDDILLYTPAVRE
jgi:hypothetical protein